MIVVIIAGGSGSRLWPLSTPDYPKHLLKINGSDRTLLQATFDRARPAANAVYVASEASHIAHVREQLPELSPDAFIVEPARRGTANCIIATLAKVAALHGDDEPVAFIHADHFIRDAEGFQRSLSLAAEVSARERRLVLIGVEPDYPATGFGYIQKDGVLSEQPLVFNVHSFKEKPDRQTAQTYLSSGNYLWNCGYFVASPATFRETMQRYAPDLFANYQRLAAVPQAGYEQAYLALESIAIDYALIEKAENLLVLPAAFDWMDLGTFADIYKVATCDERGNSVVGRAELEQVSNSLVQNTTNKPVAVIGVDNIVVINTPDGLLVVPKDLSGKVGEVSKRLG